jgi:AcrR family transcriptional regulator
MRLTRDERREQTRKDLLAAARQVFLERGFHGASLEEISAVAGYTKGAVQSNFESKDELFLAVFDEYSADRVRTFVESVLESRTFEEGVRSAASVAWQGAREEPRWIPVLTEFWTHASHREPIRRAMSERHEHAMGALAALIEELATRHGLAFTIPAREIARGSSALVRGLELERTLDPELGDARHFEEIWTAFVTGLARPREEHVQS